jgi:hypothetical protein
MQASFRLHSQDNKLPKELPGDVPIPISDEEAKKRDEEVKRGVAATNRLYKNIHRDRLA